MTDDSEFQHGKEIVEIVVDFSDGQASENRNCDGS